MPGTNFQKTYLLGETYKSTNERAIQILNGYLEYPGLITFNEIDKSITFYYEKLIPLRFTNRPRIMLLFSNPHPYSIYQGMFLSPNRKGRENLFWSSLKEAGWINTQAKRPNPRQLADICFNVNYQGPFEFVFYCYYAFPTNFPEEIPEIFGIDFFNQVIVPEAEQEFIDTILETNVDAVLVFNKGIFNLVSIDRIDKYINRLIGGELIHSHINKIDRYIPVFLTFPTGWRYKKHYKDFRNASLDAIKNAIFGELDKTAV